MSELSKTDAKKIELADIYLKHYPIVFELEQELFDIYAYFDPNLMGKSRAGRHTKQALADVWMELTEAKRVMDAELSRVRSYIINTSKEE